MKIDMSEEQLKGIISFNLRANGEIKRLKDINYRLEQENEQLKKETSREYAKELEKRIEKAREILKYGIDEYEDEEW